MALLRLPERSRCVPTFGIDFDAVSAQGHLLFTRRARPDAAQSINGMPLVAEALRQHRSLEARLRVISTPYTGQP